MLWFHLVNWHNVALGVSLFALPFILLLMWSV